MTISTMDQLVAAMPGQHRHLFKAQQTSKAAGTWHSLWKAAGQPGAGANPPVKTAGSGYVPTAATVGAIPYVDPGASKGGYLARAAAALTTIGTLILYDRLWACSGLDGTLLTAQAVTTPGALTRPDATGADVELWLEWYTATGGTAANVVADYRDQDDVASTTPSVVVTATPVVGQMQQLPLAVGDSGVRQLTSVTLSASTGTAGDFGVTLLRRVAEIPVALVGVGNVLDGLALGLPSISNAACLAMMVLCSTTNTGNLQGAVDLVQG